MNKTSTRDLMIAIFTFLLSGGESNRQAAAELIRKLSPEARRDLRATLQEVDTLLDTVILAEMKERRPWKL